VRENTVLNDKQKAKLRENVAASLTEAGIGAAYHKRTLDDLPNGAGPNVRKWVEECAREEMRAGTGWTVIGSGAVSRDAIMLIARAVHLSGFTARVLPLRRLVAQVMTNGDLLAELEACDALCVLDFFQVYPGQTVVPLTGREMQEVEAFLLERLDNARAIFVQTAKPLGGDTWWSLPLVQRLHSLNRTLDVAPVRERSR
jgi:hypothetical protein